MLVLLPESTDLVFGMTQFWDGSVQVCAPDGFLWTTGRSGRCQRQSLAPARSPGDGGPCRLVQHCLLHLRVVPANTELKCLMDREFTEVEVEVEKLIGWVREVVEVMRGYESN